MSNKLKKGIGWGLTIVLGLLFAMSAFLKLTLNPTALEQAAAIGLDPETYRMIGVVEVIALILFLIPKTGMLGGWLLIAYMGGAIATHVQHQQPLAMVVAIEAVLWIALVLRSPEMGKLLFPFGKTATIKQ